MKVNYSFYKTYKAGLCFCVIAALLSCNFFCCGLDISGALGLNTSSSTSSTGSTVAEIGDNTPTRAAKQLQENEIVYTPYKLKNSTRDFLASIDGDVTLTLISSQKDFVNGSYIEYYNNFYTNDRSYYYDVINIMKTFAELNEYIKVNFVDPYSVVSHTFMNQYKWLDVKYGDLLITCYSNFDGYPSTRYYVVEAEELFKYNASVNDDRLIKSVKAESELVKNLKSLRNSRDINVAFTSELCSTVDLDYLFKYINAGESRYNVDYVSLKDERLNGYDMIIMTAPSRDATLEEIVLLDSFLENGGKRGKTFMYFSPKDYVELPNLHAFLLKWGVLLSEKSMLYTSEDGGCFASNTQLYAKSSGSEYLKKSDLDGGSYIMNCCTPITVHSSGMEGLQVKTLLSTKAEDVTTTIRDEVISAEEEALRDFTNNHSYPLLTLSQKTDNQKTSSVVCCASVDFITSYFAMQNKNNTDGYRGNLNSNLSAVSEVMENLSHKHRKQTSGLEDYAVTSVEMGVEASSGYTKNYIITVATSLVSGFVLLLIAGLIIFNRRKNHVGS